MKNTIKLFGIIALVAVIGFVMLACKDDSGDTTLTYKGQDNNGTEWVLKITGSSYELSNGFNTSTGSVNEKQGTTYYLKPSVTATMFTATVSSGGLTELLGTIVWFPGGQPDALPGQLRPTGGTGGNNGGGDQGEEPAGPSDPILG